LPFVSLSDPAMAWEMECRGTWVDAPFKAPETIEAGKRMAFTFHKFEAEVEFTSLTESIVHCKGKQYACRLCPPQRMSNLIEEREGMLVGIDTHVDYVDCKTGQRMVHDIEANAVHGHSADHEVECDHRQSNHDAEATPAHGIATSVLNNARKLSEQVAVETDVMHDQWSLPDGRELLAELFDGREGLMGKLEEISAEAVKIFSASPGVNRVPAPAKIFGDIHGHCRDVLLFLHHYGWPSSTSPCYVFNGDWVDRGAHQLEVLMIIYSLKICYPDKVFLNRGNHEDISINKHMGASGFVGSCLKAFPEEGHGSGHTHGTEIFHKLTSSFEHLPLASVIGGVILVVHGGIGNGEWDISHLDAVHRPINTESMAADHIVYNVLWSDPIDEDKRGSFGVHDSPRDGHKNIIHRFGADITAAFLKRNKLGMVVRSHEASVGGCGYEVMHGGLCMRVFSARDYEGEKNDGSILSVSKASEMSESLVVRAQKLQSLPKNA